MSFRPNRLVRMSCELSGSVFANRVSLGGGNFFLRTNPFLFLFLFLPFQSVRVTLNGGDSSVMVTLRFKLSIRRSILLN